MILESWYWKQSLLETAQRIKSLKAAENVSEEQIVLLEKDIFVGFYSVRKLVETQVKVSDVVRHISLPICWYPNKGIKVTWRNNNKLDELYDFDSGGGEVRDIWFISGRIIHSFIFSPLFTEEGSLEAILFTSDTDKDKRLYSMHIDKVIDLFTLVGNDNLSLIVWRQDPETGEESTIVE
ncbi:MAG: hypothetical protein Q7T66_07145 [Herminiimonas sp.]|uniref:hypothetical protein n=1 Tax=Herminiimonas sp. TaxID=1926289 RepID=UPI00271810FA|nr:hypothetical protein [Herminiimonas sp.]MDO9420419.1 hypothetical protein [Herminiimonas sp.]